MKSHLILSFLVISIYWSCLSHNNYVVSGLCLGDQRSLMLQLKSNLTFDPESSTTLNSWDQSIDCCKWGGVTCDDEGHVTGIDLSGEWISGGFGNSSSLFSLQHLQILNMAYNKFTSTIPSGFNKLENLTYLNLSNAAFVGQIPREISHLTRLVTLDLSTEDHSDTWQQLKLKNPNLRKFVQNLTSIRKLYLDGVLISTEGQEWSNALLLLPGLQELSMSNCNLSGPLVSSLARLENLSVLILHQNNLSSPVPDTFAELKNLATLSLYRCELTGRFPEKIFQIQTLSVIDISDNDNLHGSFPKFPLNGSLQTIMVTNTSFSGALPPSIGNMMQLLKLDLSYCQFDGTIPSSLSKLTKLSYLDLSYNKFMGPIPSFEGLLNLISIKLSNNSINGSIPSSLFTLPSLDEIWFSNNQFSQLEEFSNVSSSILTLLDLSYNSIKGSIPSSLFKLPSLQVILLSNNQFSHLEECSNVSSYVLAWLDLSYNSLNGSIPSSLFTLPLLEEIHFSNNQFSQLEDISNVSSSVLTFVDLSYNSIKGSIPSSLFTLPSLLGISLRNNQFGRLEEFTNVSSSGLGTLDLSDNQIHGTLPKWIWKLDYLTFLNVSHNILIDVVGPFPNTSVLDVLDLQHNKLQGKIPFLTKDACLIGTTYLSLANNNFNGSIPDSICNIASYLQVLDLSHNKFSGTVPSCLITSSSLGVLNLGSNKLTGPIPNTFPTSCALQTVDLSRNHLDGPLPKSLANCTTLEVLDIGRNLIVGGFPCFLDNISTLRVLMMRKNKFHGPIGCPIANGGRQMLQIVDLAFNQFGGVLPGKWFKSWKTMMSSDEAKSKVKHIEYAVSDNDDILYQDSVTVISKDKEMVLVKIITVFTTIDFSYNQFEGPIPKELMDFKALYALNLSNNALSGHIPSSIGNLKDLESLDLSNNSLEGEIPIELASLNFLSFLNLSHNHLTGKIPTGTQLQSFQPSSFKGNDGLYGPPLSQIPNGKQAPLPPALLNGSAAVDWNFLSAELGLIFGLGIIIGPLLFWKKWRLRYWQLLDRVLCRIFPQLSLEYETHGGKRYKVLMWRH